MPIQLMTPEGEKLLAENQTPWTVYPRPQMKRDSYVNLNGEWDFTVSRLRELPEGFEKDRVLLHIGAVDQNPGQRH